MNVQLDSPTVGTNPYCLSPAVGTRRYREELDRNVQLQVLIDTQSLQSVSQMVSRTRQECATTSPYCLSPAVITQRQGEELDMNLQIQILIASVLHSVIKNREKNSIAMCSYKSLLPQSCSHYSQTERRTRQESADTSPYCLNPAVSTQRQGEELDRNVQLQVLIASALQSVLTDREKNQIGMCRYKSLLPQSCSQYSETGSRTRQECAATSPYCCSQYSETGSRTRQECAATSPYCLSPAVASALQSVLTDREKNQIGMCSYKSLLTQPCSQY